MSNKYEAIRQVQSLLVNYRENIEPLELRQFFTRDVDEIITNLKRWLE